MLTPATLDFYSSIVVSRAIIRDDPIARINDATAIVLQLRNRLPKSISLIPVTSLAQSQSTDVLLATPDRDTFRPRT